MTSTSSQNGKAFEYLACKALLQLPGAKATNRTLGKQERDAHSLLSLKPGDRQYLAFSSQFLADYVRSQSIGDFEVDRPNDSAGEDGDPSDLTLITPARRLRISLKNANFSIKHQRPSALARHLGFENGTVEANSWESLYKSAVSKFFQYLEPEQKTISASDIDSEMLYADINLPACQYINEVSTRISTAASSMYDFLVGPEGLIIATASKKGVTLSRWSYERKPSQVIATLKGDGIDLAFSNGHIFHLRLHTADSTLNVHSPSLKWDTRSDSPMSLVARKSF